MYDNRDNIDFAHTNTRKLFASIFFPTLLGMLFSMAFIFTDGIFVGHGIGSHGLAAINLIGPIMMLINGLGMMLGVGVSVVAAIHMSQNNIKAARINVTQAYMAGILIAFIVGLFCYIFPDTVLQLLGVKNNSGLYTFAREYYLWFLPTCLLMMVETIGLFVIRLDGSPRYAMLSFGELLHGCILHAFPHQDLETLPPQEQHDKHTTGFAQCGVHDKGGKLVVGRRAGGGRDDADGQPCVHELSGRRRSSCIQRGMLPIPLSVYDIQCRSAIGTAHYQL